MKYNLIVKDMKGRSTELLVDISWDVFEEGRYASAEGCIRPVSGACFYERSAGTATTFHLMLAERANGGSDFWRWRLNDFKDWSGANEKGDGFCKLEGVGLDFQAGKFYWYLLA